MKYKDDELGIEGLFPDGPILGGADPLAPSIDLGRDNSLMVPKELPVDQRVDKDYDLGIVPGIEERLRNLDEKRVIGGLGIGNESDLDLGAKRDPFKNR